MGVKRDMRKKQFNIRLSNEEAERLERLAKHFGINKSDVLRMLVKRAVRGDENDNERASGQK